MESGDLRKYHISRMNMIKTLRFRGHPLPEGLYDISQEDFEEKYEDEANLQGVKEKMSEELIIEGTGQRQKILVIWLVDRKLGANVRDVKNKISEEKAQHAIVVADEGITHQARDTIRRLRTTEKIFIDVWTLDETMIFVPDHSLVPGHRICSARERRQIFETYGLKAKERKVPHIRTDDIMVRYLGASKGHLIELRRPSETNPGQTDLSYRLVC